MPPNFCFSVPVFLHFLFEGIGGLEAVFAMELVAHPAVALWICVSPQKNHQSLLTLNTRNSLMYMYIHMSIYIYIYLGRVHAPGRDCFGKQRADDLVQLGLARGTHISVLPQIEFSGNEIES